MTLDERGCVAFYRDGSGGIAEEMVDRIEVEHVVDTTGAGDSFAAGLAYGYLAYRDYVVACQYGNAMGAQRCTGTELDVYLPRRETERQILAAYGPRSWPGEVRERRSARAGFTVINGGKPLLNPGIRSGMTTSRETLPTRSARARELGACPPRRADSVDPGCLHRAACGG